MGFAVTHEGGAKASEYQAYVRLLSRQLLKRGVDLSHIPRVPEEGNGKSWLYVWEKEAEASAFADQLKKETRDRRWIVQPVSTRPSVGPLRPLEVNVGRQGDGWVFGLEPFTRLTLQVKFPDSCSVPRVFIASKTPDEFLNDPNRLRVFAERVLLILTELDPEQLREFGSFRVFDAAAHIELLPPVLLSELNAR